jgi:hypothetical protein
MLGIPNALFFFYTAALVEIYTLALAAIIVVLESQQKVEFIKKEHLDLLHKYALFLKYVWGRGCLYLVAGTISDGMIMIVDSLDSSISHYCHYMLPTGSLQLTQGQLGNFFVGCVSLCFRFPVWKKRRSSLGMLLCLFGIYTVRHVRGSYLYCHGLDVGQETGQPQEGDIGRATGRGVQQAGGQWRDQHRSVLGPGRRSGHCHEAPGTYIIITIDIVSKLDQSRSLALAR